MRRKKKPAAGAEILFGRRQVGHRARTKIKGKWQKLMEPNAWPMGKGKSRQIRGGGKSTLGGKKEVTDDDVLGLRKKKVVART